MIRRISTQWVLGVSTAVVVPFVGFAFFVNTKVSDRLAGDVVRYHLLSMAGDLTNRIDEEIAERRLDVETLASENVLQWFVGAYDRDDAIFESTVLETFNRTVERSGAYDLVLAVDAAGRYSISNHVDRSGYVLSDETLRALRERDWSREPWFRAAMEHGWALVDWHENELLPSGGDPGVSDPLDYCVGFAHRIGSSADGEPPVGVVYVLMNWKNIQDEVSTYGVRQLHGAGEDSLQVGQALGEDIYKSSYAWIWKADADTIIAHPLSWLYGELVSGEAVDLPELVAAARGADWGMYPDYTFLGKRKKAAFKRCRAPEEGGFGWVVGIGIDDKDIYAPVNELSRLLYAASAIVLLVTVLWTVIIARRTTRPIQELSKHTRRIATSGDLDARIDLGTHDELGDLAEDFNRMTAELKEKRQQLVRAEKDAAWREMARQVAHEIKNPLTPISLSVGLLKRSRAEGSPEFDRIFERTMDMIQRQVETMREIARDFYAFAGEQRTIQELDVGVVLDEILELHAGQAAHAGVEVVREGTGAVVNADPDELRRALLNLVQNALEAMPDGGRLTAWVGSDEREVALEIRDTGEGLSPEIEARLFEPYFTTRSSGTGLGLAIVRRVIGDMGGRVELRNAGEGRGAVARVVLPRG